MIAGWDRFGEEITRLRSANLLIDRVLETANKCRMGPAIISKVEQVSCKVFTVCSSKHTYYVAAGGYLGSYSRNDRCDRGE